MQTLDGLGVEKVFVVGHSFGGYTAANLALRAPAGSRAWACWSRWSPSPGCR